MHAYLSQDYILTMTIVLSSGRSDSVIWQCQLLWKRAERILGSLLSGHWYWQWASQCHTAHAHRRAQLHCLSRLHCSVSMPATNMLYILTTS